jgi:acetyl esterase/lipase
MPNASHKMKTFHCCVAVPLLIACAAVTQTSATTNSLPVPDRRSGPRGLEGNLGNTNFSSRVQAVVDWFGPTDVTLIAQQSGSHSMIQHDSPNSPESHLLGGPVQEKRDLARTANPITYIDKSSPPFLIMHGDNDQFVPLGQSVILAKALIDAGVEVTMKTIPGAGHEGPEFRSAESRQLIEEFLSRNLKADK